MMTSFPEAEVAWRTRIADVYNSGDCEAAVRLADEFLREHPNAPLARYCVAVMRGDFSYDSRHSVEEASRLKQIAISGVWALLEDPQFGEWPLPFQHRVRNEHYFFNEMSEEQYQLGLERIALGEEGDYPACVGASGMALRLLKAGDVEAATSWARKSIQHFAEFEKKNPTWYNINHFGAQSAACLGEYEIAERIFRAMFGKMKKPVDEKELESFRRSCEEIKALRGDGG